MPVSARTGAAQVPAASAHPVAPHPGAQRRRQRWKPFLSGPGQAHVAPVPTSCRRSDDQPKSVHSTDNDMVSVDTSQHEGFGSAASPADSQAAHTQPALMAELHHAAGLLASRLRLSGPQDVQDFLAALILSECAYKKVEMGHQRVARKVSQYAAMFGGMVQLDAIQITLDDVPQHYIVCTGADALYVAFMGTKQARDLFADVSIVHEPVWAEALALAADNQSTPAAHSGFLARARAIDVEQLYALAQEQGRRLVLCGHSLGGAVAKLAALRLLRELPEWPAPRLRCIGFAVPAVGNPALARLVESAGWDHHFSSYSLPEDPLMRVVHAMQRVRQNSNTPVASSAVTPMPGGAPMSAVSAPPPVTTTAGTPVALSSSGQADIPPTPSPQAAADGVQAAMMVCTSDPAGASGSTTTVASTDTPSTSASGRGSARSGHAGWYAWGGALPAWGSWVRSNMLLRWGSGAGAAAPSPQPAAGLSPSLLAEADAISDREAAAVEDILSASPRPNLSAQTSAGAVGDEPPLHASSSSSSSSSSSKGMQKPERSLQHVAAQDAMLGDAPAQVSTEPSRDGAPVQEPAAQASPSHSSQAPTNFALRWALGRSRALRQLQWLVPQLPLMLVANPTFHMFGSHLYLGQHAIWPASESADVLMNPALPPSDLLARPITPAGMPAAQSPFAVAAGGAAGAPAAAAAGKAAAAASPGLLATAASIMQGWLPTVSLPRSPLMFHSMKAHRRRVLALVQQCRDAVREHGAWGSASFVAASSTPTSLSVTSLEHDSVDGVPLETLPTASIPTLGASVSAADAARDGQARLQPGASPVQVQVRTDLVPRMRAVRAVARLPLPPSADLLGARRQRTGGAAAGGPRSAGRQVELLVVVDGSRLQLSRSVTASWLPAGSTTSKPLQVRVLYTRTHAQEEEEAAQAQLPGAATPEAKAVRQGWRAVQASMRNVLHSLGRSIWRFGRPGGAPASPDHQCSVALAVTLPEEALAQLTAHTLQTHATQSTATSSRDTPPSQQDLPDVPLAGPMATRGPQLHLVFRSDFQHEAIKVALLPWRVALLAASRASQLQLQAALAQAAQGAGAAPHSPVQVFRALRTANSWVPWPGIRRLAARSPLQGAPAAAPAAVALASQAALQRSRAAVAVAAAAPLPSDGLEAGRARPLASRRLQAAALVAATMLATTADVPGSRAADGLLPADLTTTAALVMSLSVAAGVTGPAASKLAALPETASRPASTEAALLGLGSSTMDAAGGSKVGLPAAQGAPPVRSAPDGVLDEVTLRGPRQRSDWVDPWLMPATAPHLARTPSSAAVNSTTNSPAAGLLAAGTDRGLGGLSRSISSPAAGISESPTGRTTGSGDSATTGAPAAARPRARWVERLAAQARFAAAAAPAAADGSTQGDAQPPASHQQQQAQQREVIQRRQQRQQQQPVGSSIMFEEYGPATWQATPLRPAQRGRAHPQVQKAIGWLPRHLARLLPRWLSHLPAIPSPLPASPQGPHQLAAGSLALALTTPGALLVVAGLSDEELKAAARSPQVASGVRAAQLAGVPILPVLLSSGRQASAQRMEAGCMQLAALCGVKPGDVRVVDLTVLVPAQDMGLGRTWGPVPKGHATQPDANSSCASTNGAESVRALQSALLGLLQQQHARVAQDPAAETVAGEEGMAGGSGQGLDAGGSGLKGARSRL